MTTLTINEDIDIKTDYKTYDELVNFILYQNSVLEYENLDDNEVSFLESMDSFKKFKNIANSI
jgi:hypothetical protein